MSSSVFFARATTTTRTTCAMSTTTGTRTTTTTTTAMASRRIRWSYHVASQAAKQRRRATPRIVPPEYIIVHLIMVYSGCIGSLLWTKKEKEQNILLNSILQVDAFSSKENLTISSLRRINEYDYRCGTREVTAITV